MPKLAAAFPKYGFMCEPNDTSLYKQAVLGGDGNDVQFEQSFSNLAHSFLRNIAPSLLDHEVGFQLLDRNDENTRAAGMFVFKVGSQTLLAPMFFLRGRLKGHELLYLKEQDIFVPLKQNWVTYIQNRKPRSIGTPASKNFRDLGITPTDLSALSQSPSTKFASSCPLGIRRELPTFAKFATADVQGAYDDFKASLRKLSLPEFLKKADLAAISAAADLFRHHPKTAAAYCQYHPMDELLHAASVAAARPVKTRVKAAATTDSVMNAPVSLSVRVIYMDQVSDDGMLDVLDSDDKESLFRDRYVVQDQRKDDQVSTPVEHELSKQLFSPSETGVYEVLVRPGKFEKCLVVMQPHGPAGRLRCATVIALSNSKRWCNVSSTNVLCAQHHMDEFKTWFKELPKGSLSTEGTFIAIGERGDATAPFTVDRLITDDAFESAAVRFDTYTSDDSESENPNEQYSGHSYSRYRDGEYIRITPKQGGRCRADSGNVYVPQEFKLWRLKNKPDDLHGFCCTGMSLADSRDSEQDNSPLQIGRLADAQLFMLDKTAAFKIVPVGSNFSINGESEISRVAAIGSLIQAHGFREKVACDLLHQSVADHGLRCRIKYAEDYPRMNPQYGPSFPDMSSGGANPMGFQGETEIGQERTVPTSIPKSDPSAYKYDREGDQAHTAKRVQEAAATGDREIFDASMLGSMLRATNDDALVDQYIPPLMQALNALGRLLFNFYWHGAKFAERYGKSDMPELEDALRNTFEAVGDTVLFLKQKSVSAYPEDDVLGVSLSDAAD